MVPPTKKKNNNQKGVDSNMFFSCRRKGPTSGGRLAGSGRKSGTHNPATGVTVVHGVVVLQELAAVLINLEVFAAEGAVVVWKPVTVRAGSIGNCIHAEA